MAIYEFHCAKHGAFDVFQRMNAKHQAACPECGARARRVYSPATTVVDFSAGWDMGLGMNIDTKKQRDEELRKRNLGRIRV